jgi:ATP-binding protein involved in chromosome partitioning
MSYYQPAPEAPPVYIFGRGGGAELARQLDVPMFGEIPLDQAVREGGDRGRPIVVTAPETPSAKALRQAAARLREAVPLPVKV